jgi:septal ring factor EnvC (AmiA/AmiB activator)
VKRRADDYSDEGTRLRSNGGVTWKVVATSLAAIIMVGGGAWLTSIAGEISTIKAEQAKDREKASELKTNIGVMDEKVRRIERDVKEIKEDSKEQNRKLDELLRRTR